MKKLFIAIVVGSLLFMSCADKEETVQSGKLDIITTTFPAYDWAKNVIGEHSDLFNLDLLSDTGVDIHSFQPSIADMVTLTTSDLLIYIGGDSEYWVNETLNKEDSSVTTLPLNLMEELRAISPNLILAVEDSAHEHDDEHNHDAHDHDEECDDATCDHHHHHEEGFVHEDEHIWLSLKNAQLAVTAIAEYISQLDPEHENDYFTNARNYNKKLESLSNEYKATVDSANVKTLVFGDRFPFLYMSKDYGFDYYAAYVGCSSETEASFETIAFLAEKVDELALKNIIAIEGSKAEIASTIIENTKTENQSILRVHSAQSMTKEEIEGGITYLSIMEDNLEVLKIAFQN